MGLDPLSRAVAAAQHGQYVAHLLGVVLGLRPRQLHQLLLQGVARRGEQPRGRVPGRDAQPVRRPAVHDARRPDQRRVAIAGGPRAARRPAEPEVKAAGVQGVDQAELLDRRQGGAVAELHGAGSDPDRPGRRGGQGQDDRGRGPGHAGVEVVLGVPVPRVAESLGVLGQVDAIAEGLGGGRARGDRHQVEHGERGGGHVRSFASRSQA